MEFLNHDPHRVVELDTLAITYWPKSMEYEVATFEDGHYAQSIAFRIKDNRICNIRVCEGMEPRDYVNEDYET